MVPIAPVERSPVTSLRDNFPGYNAEVSSYIINLTLWPDTYVINSPEVVVSIDTDIMDVHSVVILLGTPAG